MTLRHLYGDGTVLAYAEAGTKTGRPLLIQHGMVAGIEDWDLFRPLFPAFRLIAAARPGYGGSSPAPLADVGSWGPLMAGLADELDLGEFDVLAISSGAPYGYSIARHLPKKTGTLYIFSGIPALYDPQVAALWPYPVDQDADLPSLQKLAGQLFFSSLSDKDRSQNDIRDSMAHDAYGPALDLKIRVRRWGFDLSEVRTPVVLQHAADDRQVPFATAERTAALLPNCRFERRKSGGHFSPGLLQTFLKTAVLGEPA